jgi:NAD(P)-dependent dehydrogenase (short-subunit alcohol dehydrogenase family)
MSHWRDDLPPNTPSLARLAGKVAVVTGAGSSGPGLGNGRASAILMARQGAIVALLDLSSTAAAETLEVILSEGGEATVLECDVSSPASCDQAISKLTRDFGRADVLINNVGILGPRGTAVDVVPEDWDRAMATNVTSMVLMAKGCIPLMRRSGRGSIVNVASIAGIQGGHPDLFYPTSKGAIIQLTRAMAAQHGAEGIRVNCVAPGMIYTPMVSGGMDAAAREHRRLQSLLKTEGNAWDVALAALFLASDDSRWITGIVLPVDGGVLAGPTAGVTGYATSS